MDASVVYFVNIYTTLSRPLNVNSIFFYVVNKVSNIPGLKNAMLASFNLKKKSTKSVANSHKKGLSLRKVLYTKLRTRKIFSWPNVITNIEKKVFNFSECF